MSAVKESKGNRLDGRWSRRVAVARGRREGADDAITHGADGNNVGEVEKSHP